MKKPLLICASALAFCSPASWAQQYPVYESTGTVELTVKGEKATYHSTSNTIPGQPDKLVQTANWRTSAPMMLGGVNLAPPGILVSIASRPTVEPDPAAPQLKITFSVDENDYSLIETAPLEVIYTIKEGSEAGEYRHASGSLTLSSVTPEGDVLKVSGNAAGTLVGANSKKGAGQTLDYEADFIVHAHRH